MSSPLLPAAAFTSQSEERNPPSGCLALPAIDLPSWVRLGAGGALGSGLSAGRKPPFMYFMICREHPQPWGGGQPRDSQHQSRQAGGHWGPTSFLFLRKRGGGSETPRSRVPLPQPAGLPWAAISASLITQKVFMDPLLAQIPGTGRPGPTAGGLFVLAMKGLLLGLHPGPSLRSLNGSAIPSSGLGAGHHWI